MANLINNIDNFLGKIIFNSFSSLRYCIFNSLIYHANLKKKLRENEIISNFNDKGFCKIKSLNSKDTLELKKIFKKENSKLQKSNDYVFKAKINTREEKELIKNMILNNFSDVLNDLKTYYNSNIYLTNVEFKKTFHIDKKDEKEEYFNNFFHIDSYLRTHFKIFVNVSDIEEKNGPTEIFDIEKTKKIRKFNSFKNKRGNLKIPKDLNAYQNIGKSGHVILCNTSLCLHRATSPLPQHTRENLILTFVSYPNSFEDIFYYEKKDPESIWSQKNIITKSLAKPHRYKDIFLLTNKFI
jgi:hypothetical protein